MDTREKITTLAEVAERHPKGLLTAVIGVFDPFTIMAVRAIREHSHADRDLLVVVAPGEGTLLSAEARAALVAALRDVDAVVIAKPAEARALLATVPAIEIFEDAFSDGERTRKFVEFVLARQASGEEGAAG